MLVRKSSEFYDSWEGMYTGREPPPVSSYGEEDLMRISFFKTSVNRRAAGDSRVMDRC